MRYSLLCHYVRKEILFKKNMYRKVIESMCFSKLTNLVTSDMEKSSSKPFSDSSNSSKSLLNK